MKILIVNSFDIKGGAARAAYRLHRALLAEGLESQMLVQTKLSDDYTVIGAGTKFQKAVSVLRPILDDLPVLLYRQRTATLFSPGWVPLSNIVDRINNLKPDLVHLHWIAGGMLRIEDIQNIKVPMVWSLHDMWPFTGGCHYDEQCGRFKQHCGICKVLRSEKKKDLSAKVHSRKQKAYSAFDNIYIVGLSKWLAQSARESFLFRNLPVLNIPNPLDTSVFAPHDKSVARDLMKLPKHRKLVLFGALAGTDDTRKGFRELSSALECVDTDNTELVVFGSSQPQTPYKFKQKAHYLGHLHDNVSLRLLYNAADVMVVPSLQENLVQTAIESMACGTPVVAFGTTGLLDIVDHKENGYLAKPFITTDLAAGINWVLNSADNVQLAKNAREKAVSTFDSRLVAQQYIQLYKSILNK